MLYKVQNLTMNIDTTDGDVAGDCICYIPFEHKCFLKDMCGMEKNEDFKAGSYGPIFMHEYGEVNINESLKHYWTTSADILIAYLSWLMRQDGEQTVNVEYERPFWAIHDAQHALNDESGCTIYVDAHIELERLHEAFKLMIENGYAPDHELIEEVTEAYNGRFGENVSFEEYYPEEELAEINVEYICPECEHEWNEDRTDEEASTCPECETEDVDADCWDYL